jgi:Ca2+-binding EF-hand superfamily protein
VSEQTEGELRQEFDRFDTNKNGTIDEDEFSALVATLGVRFTAEQLQIAFAAIDIDGNQTIDFREFKGWWTKRSKV